MKKNVFFVMFTFGSERRREIVNLPSNVMSAIRVVNQKCKEILLEHEELAYHYVINGIETVAQKRFRTPNDERIFCVIDGSWGRYVGREFVGIGGDVWIYDREDLDGLLKNPDHEQHDVAFEALLDTAYYVDVFGYTWTLYMDSDLFAVREDYEFPD